MNKHRIISLLLSLVIALGTFSLASCGDSKETANPDVTAAENDENSTAPAVTAEAVDPRLAVSDDLPEADYKGYNFRILATDDYCKIWVPEDQVGEVINDAVYKRNKDIEERFNITISSVSSGQTAWDKHAAQIKKSIMAGDDAFDLALAHVIGAPNLSLESLFYNMRDVKQFNFDKPWWPKQSVEELTFKGKMYVGTNTISYTGLGFTKVVYFNKDKLADYGMDVPYQLVFDGKWTIDKLAELTRNVYEDVNGNGVRDNADFYGYISHSVQNGFLVSCDCPVLNKTDDTIEIVANTPRVQGLVDKMYDWYTSVGAGICWTNPEKESGLDQQEWQAMMFSNGRGLYAFSWIKDAVNVFRSSDVVYGILPQPKYDENQENYRAFTVDEFFCIPQTVQDIDRTGTIIEAMSAEGYKQIIPAYYEIALKKKYLHDDESVRILDLITNARTVSFAYVYDNWQGFGHLFSQIFSGKPNKDFTSFYEKRVTGAQKRIDAIAAGFEAGA